MSLKLLFKIFAGLQLMQGVMIARWHPVSIIVGALASPIPTLNLSLTAGWFAGYTQLKMAPPTGKDALISSNNQVSLVCYLGIK